MMARRRVASALVLSAGLLVSAGTAAGATQYLPPGITCRANALIAAAQHPNPQLTTSLVGIGDFDQVLTEFASQCVNFGTLSPQDASLVSVYRDREVAVRIHRLYPKVSAAPWPSAVGDAAAAYRIGKPVLDPLASRNFLHGIVEGTSIEYLPPADSLTIVVRDLDHAAHDLLYRQGVHGSLRALVERTERRIHRMAGVPLAAERR
ncbi:MAG TPA: hypothetical protein VNJ51_06870 [Candidatus Dormibacteraeota bacterium]|nr:hypothetical protein [Candidatus Dormibacteraeota bacterium]